MIFRNVTQDTLLRGHAVCYKRGTQRALKPAMHMLERPTKYGIAVACDEIRPKEHGPFVLPFAESRR